MHAIRSRATMATNAGLYGPRVQHRARGANAWATSKLDSNWVRLRGDVVLRFARIGMDRLFISPCAKACARGHTQQPEALLRERINLVT